MGLWSIRLSRRTRRKIEWGTAGIAFSTLLLWGGYQNQGIFTPETPRQAVLILPETERPAPIFPPETKLDLPGSDLQWKLAMPGGYDWPFETLAPIGSQWQLESGMPPPIVREAIVLVHSANAAGREDLWLPPTYFVGGHEDWLRLPPPPVVHYWTPPGGGGNRQTWPRNPVDNVSDPPVAEVPEAGMAGGLLVAAVMFMGRRGKRSRFNADGWLNIQHPTSNIEH
jgi:hypothetical protein